MKILVEEHKKQFPKNKTKIYQKVKNFISFHQNNANKDPNMFMTLKINKILNKQKEIISKQMVNMR